MRRFEAARAAQADAEPLVFEVEGERFEVPQPIPQIAVIALAEMAAVEDSSDQPAVTAFSALSEFFAAVLGRSEWARLKRVMIDHRWSIDDVTQIVQWIVEESTGRPTTPPSG
jgi:hypothetical protein